MSRVAVDYLEGGNVVAVAGSYSTEAPVAGFYKTRLRSGAHPVGVKIWFGAPLDPITGEELDRCPRWQAVANAKPVDLDRVWPKCGIEPIDEREYRYLTSLQEWAVINAPDSPQANPHRKINPLTAPTPF